MSFSNLRCLVFSLFISNFQHPSPKFIPNFRHPNPKFIHHFPFSNSTRRLYSRSHDGEDNPVSSFKCLLHQNPTPSIFRFGKILSSLVKANYYCTAASLHPQMVLKGFASDLVSWTILINCFSHLALNSLFCICQHSREGLSPKCHNFQYNHQGPLSQRSNLSSIALSLQARSPRNINQWVM